MTSGSDPKTLSERAARLEAMFDDIMDEPGHAVDPAGAPVAAKGEGENAGADEAHAGRAAANAENADVSIHAAKVPAAANVPAEALALALPALATPSEASTPDLEQLDADWGDEAAAGQVSEADMLAAPKGYDDDEDDYDAKTVIGRVPDLVALTRKNAPEPSTQIKTPRAAPVETAPAQRDVPTIRPEPKVVIDDGGAAVIPQLDPLRGVDDATEDAVDAGARPSEASALLSETPSVPPAGTASPSTPPDTRDPAARAADRAALAERAAAKKAKDRARVEALRDRKKARVEAAAKKQKGKQPRRSRPPPPPDSETDTFGTSLDADDAIDADTGVSLARKPATSLGRARDFKKMATLVAIVVALGALIFAWLLRK